MICPAKHVKQPIPPDDWKCPKCGAGPESFAVWDSEYPLECEGDHPDDWAECMECGYGATLSTITKNYWKNKNVTWVKCPHCRGTGMVKDSKNE